jgi:hypothetical protein
VCGRQSHNGPLHSWSQPNRLFGHQVSHFMQLRLSAFFRRAPDGGVRRKKEEAVEIINHLLKPTVFSTLQVPGRKERNGTAEGHRRCVCCASNYWLGWNFVWFFFSLKFCFQLLMTPEATRWSGRITSTESWPLISLNEAARP